MKVTLHNNPAFIVQTDPTLANPAPVVNLPTKDQMLSLANISRTEKPFMRVIETGLLLDSKVVATNPGSIKEVKEQKFSQGRWTKKEQELFVQALEKFGKDWKKIQDFVITRSSTQARSHAQKYLAKIHRASLGKGAKASQRNVEPTATRTSTPFVSPMYKGSAEAASKMAHPDFKGKRLLFDSVDDGPQEKCKRFEPVPYYAPQFINQEPQLLMLPSQIYKSCYTFPYPYANTVGTKEVQPKDPGVNPHEGFFEDHELSALEQDSTNLHDIPIIELRSEVPDIFGDCDVFPSNELPDITSLLKD